MRSRRARIAIFVTTSMLFASYLIVAIRVGNPVLVLVAGVFVVAAVAALVTTIRDRPFGDLTIDRVRRLGWKIAALAAGFVLLSIVLTVLSVTSDYSHGFVFAAGSLFIGVLFAFAALRAARSVRIGEVSPRLQQHWDEAVRRREAG